MEVEGEAAVGVGLNEVIRVDDNVRWGVGMGFIFEEMIIIWKVGG